MELVSIWYDTVQGIFSQSEGFQYPSHKSRLIAIIGRKKTLPPMVGKIFLRLIGATTLPKCTPASFFSSHFIKQVAILFLRDIHYPFRCFTELLFFSQKRSKKRSKRRPQYYNWIFYHYSIGCVFHTENPSKRCSIFSNSINAISSFLHCFWNPLKR